jgi:hypothetical protein
VAQTTLARGIHQDGLDNAVKNKNDQSHSAYCHGLCRPRQRGGLGHDIGGAADTRDSDEPWQQTLTPSLAKYIYIKKNYTDPADVWDALHEMCNNENWEDQTWSLAHALGTPYDVGDEYTDIITVLCLGLIDNFVV